MGSSVNKIDIEQLEHLAECQCTIEEIAAVLCVSKETIEEEYAADIANARLRGIAKLRILQWRVAEALNPAMLNHLGKFYLDQSENRKEPEKETGDVTYIAEWGCANEKPGNKRDFD